MKIQSFSNVLPIRSMDIKDREGSGRQSQDQGHQQRKQDSSDEKPESFPATLEKVQAAVQSFGSEAQASGLEATTEGIGLGLRVVLKDGTGAVVRQLSGEEFLRMREAASTSTGPRGRLFDRKV